MEYVQQEFKQVQLKQAREWQVIKLKIASLNETRTTSDTLSINNKIVEWLLVILFLSFEMDICCTYLFIWDYFIILL